MTDLDRMHIGINDWLIHDDSDMTYFGMTDLDMMNIDLGMTDLDIDDQLRRDELRC